MTQETNKSGTNDENRENSSEDGVGQTLKEKREKNIQPTKVVMRRLPPTMSMEMFLDQISPVPDNDYIYFVKADFSLGQNAFARAYINFLHQDDIFLFKEKFDGYIFVDQQGAEYPAVVEFAPFQKIPKKKPKKFDSKCGTIEQDPGYLKFLESLSHPEEINLPSVEYCLEEIETRERELRANIGGRNSTPLIEYLKQKKAEKLRIREEKREERKRREVEKKRQKEEERRRKKAEKEKGRDHEANKEKNRTPKDRNIEDKGKTEPIVKLLKNPEREKPKEQEKDLNVSEKDGNPENITYHDKVSQDDVQSSSRERSTKEKDWESDRERRRHTDDKLFRHREKPRERRDRDRPRKEREDQVKSGLYGKSMHGRTVEKSRMSSSTSKSSDWHSERNERAGYRLGSYNDSRTSRGKGKSYEKSRESLSKEGKELKTGLTVDVGCLKDSMQGSFETQNPGIDENDVLDCVESVVTTLDTVQMDNYGECDKKTYLSPQVVAKVEHHSYRRERASRDPRMERRIRNKDRPSIELYRPGMRRLSLQRNSPQKESSSSSPSPTMSRTAQHENSIEMDDKAVLCCKQEELEHVGDLEVTNDTTIDTNSNPEA